MESIKNNPSLLENLTYESKGKQRKISKTSIEKIKKYLFNIEQVRCIYKMSLGGGYREGALGLNSVLGLNNTGFLI